MDQERLESPYRTNVGFLSSSLAMALFAIIALLIGIDIAVDYRSGTRPSHVLAEGLVMALAVVGLVLMWRRFNLVQHEAKQLRVDLETAEREAQRFREEAHDALRGLGEAIDRQFARWALTPAEREVGLFLLKGLTHKEIATIRSTSETTIRQQALAVYRKSGLRGRTELSAFFLEDLLLPVGQR